jgi:hypothetical protein
VLRIDIAGEYLRPFDEHEAARLRRANLAAFTGIEADDPGARERRPKSDAPLNGRPAAGIERDSSRGLGHPIGLVELDSRLLKKTLGHDPRTDRPAGQPHADGGDICIANRYFGQGHDRCRDAPDDRNPECFDQFPICPDRLAVRRPCGEGKIT